MAGKSTFSVRLDPEKRRVLDSLAESMDRPRSYLVEQAIDQYLEHHVWMLERIEEARAEADRGELIEHDDLFRELRERYRPGGR